MSINPPWLVLSSSWVRKKITFEDVLFFAVVATLPTRSTATSSPSLNPRTPMWGSEKFVKNGLKIEPLSCKWEKENRDFGDFFLKVFVGTRSGDEWRRPSAGRRLLRGRRTSQGRRKTAASGWLRPRGQPQAVGLPGSYHRYHGKIEKHHNGTMTILIPTLLIISMLCCQMRQPANVRALRT